MSATTRFLVARGRSTAVRLALPALGTVSIGSGPNNDLRLREPSVASEHALVFLDHGIGVRFLEADSARLGPGGEERVRPGTTLELEVGDRVRIGQVELGFAEGIEAEQSPRVLGRAYFERRLQALGARADAAGRGASVARIQVRGGVPEDSVEAAISARLRPGDLFARIATGDWAILFGASTDSHAHQLVTELARVLVPQGADLLAGIAGGAGSGAGELLEVAAQRLSRPSLSVRSRLYTSRDPAMQAVEKLVDKVARGATHVLILGETGVGKDVIAQLVHERSARSQGPFIRVSSVDLPDSFLEEAATNFLARARGGTVHLDEVAGLSPRAQLGLGYLLDEAPSTGHDVRFLATANQDLNAHVASGTFRKDLFFRLNQVTITIPPLRERTSDIVPLAELFLARAAEVSQRGVPQLSEAAAGRLESYSWPGNVRELSNVVERALLMSQGSVIGVEHLPPELSSDATPPASRPRVAAEEPDTADDEVSPGTGKPGSLREEIAALEKKRIIEALQKHPTQRDAAASLDMPMRTFLNRLDALGIPRARGGGGGGKQS